jgi:hypothetical protein
VFKVVDGDIDCRSPNGRFFPCAHSAGAREYPTFPSTSLYGHPERHRLNAGSLPEKHPCIALALISPATARFLLKLLACAETELLFHRIASGIETGRERPLEIADLLIVRGFLLLILLLNLFSRLASGLLVRGGVRLALLSPTSYNSHGCANCSTCACVAIRTTGWLRATYSP